MTITRDVADSRGYPVLPQRSGEGGYYTYGTPGNGAGQFAHPRMMTFLFQLEFRWGADDRRSVGIGNISLANGASYPPHRSHRSGLEVDIRPMRKDGLRSPVRWMDSNYDREGTRRLVEVMCQTGMVRRVLFNDISILRVTRAPRHDDHLHVEVIA